MASENSPRPGTIEPTDVPGQPWDKEPGEVPGIPLHRPNGMAPPPEKRGAEEREGGVPTHVDESTDAEAFEADRDAHRALEEATSTEADRRGGSLPE